VEISSLSTFAFSFITRVVVDAMLTGLLMVEFSILVLIPKLLSFFLRTRLNGLVFESEVWLFRYPFIVCIGNGLYFSLSDSS